MKLAPLIIRAEDDEALLANAKIVSNEIKIVANLILDKPEKFVKKGTKINYRSDEWWINVEKVKIKVLLLGKSTDVDWCLGACNSENETKYVEIYHTELPMLLAHLDKEILEGIIENYGTKKT